ncbi:DNA-directed RNA polymerase subunit beta [Candidatus Nomurabacteria bacterium]|nr:DNA-directed RNA polymerase subunit beta [Candidatus Nomurabacteria bacterium]
MSKTSTIREKKTFSRYKEPLVPIPNLVETQVESYRHFLENGLRETIAEFSPLTDYADKKFRLEFLDFTYLAPEEDEYFCKDNKKTYQGILKSKIKLVNRALGTEVEQEIMMTEIPMITDHGTFIINGAERVFVPQIARSYGVFFTDNETKFGIFFGAKIIPGRGIWIEMEAEKDKVIQVRIDKKRKFPVTQLLRIMGLSTNEEILAAFKGKEDIQKFLAHSLAKDSTTNADEAYVEMYRKLRDGEQATVENAREFIDNLFSDERYDLSRVGRYQFNKRFDMPTGEKSLDDPTLSPDDILRIVEHVVLLNITPGSKADDIDHLGSRRIRYAGELLQQKVRKGMSQMKRNIQDKMSTIDNETTQPIQIVNTRPLQARVKEFFSTNQLSQYMSQENIVGEIEDIRKLSALGPGGLTRERAGFEVRDIHPSHYGRVCPVHTPEGPNIGLILHLALYARINEFGMIETPYVKVDKGVITGEIVYMNAFEEERKYIAHAGTNYDEKGKIKDSQVEVRYKGDPVVVEPKDVQYIDVATNQTFSVATSLIPFLENDAANRALMGSNMQKQGTPCIIPQAPLVATGIEEQAARDTGRLILAPENGTIKEIDGRKIVVSDSKGKDHTMKLVNYSRSNNYSIMHQRPLAHLTVGSKVKKGDILADASTTDNGQVAVGQNALVAFMCWQGHNFEDAIIISQRLVKENSFTSIRVHEYECIVRDTKLGEEQTTYDIPNVSELKLRNLDEDGIIRVGAEVHENDILVGKITPKGEKELSPEERLLRSIFGEKARDVKDTSLRLGHGKKGRVIGVKVFAREQGDELESGILKKIYVEVAELRPVQVGDKLAGRHGNKGVISVVLPEEDMPYMEDGTPIDIVLTPLGVPSRMNLGQVLEMHLGLAAQTLDYQAIVPPFSGATESEIKNELEAAGFDRSGKVTLIDGQTGERFDQPIAVGYMYMLKLHHMVADKMHARAIGPYSLITQQPLGGKSQSGGQRFGEMEVWALEGYGAAHTLREMLTVKSDDIVGRSETFDAIIHGNRIKEPNAPAAFNVLLKYLRGLSLNVEIRGSRHERSEEAEA